MLGHLLQEVVPQAGRAIAVVATGQPKPRLRAEVAPRVTWLTASTADWRQPLRAALAPLPPEGGPVALIGAVRLGVGQALQRLARQLDAHPVAWAATGEGAALDAVLAVYRLPALRDALESWSEGEDGREDWLRRAASAPGQHAMLDSPPPVLTLEDYRQTLTRLGLCSLGHPPVDLELYGSLRIVGGCTVLPLRADCIGTAVECMRRVQPALGRLLPSLATLGKTHRFAINGGTITTDVRTALGPGDRLAVFSASVGG